VRRGKWYTERVRGWGVLAAWLMVALCSTARAESTPDRPRSKVGLTLRPSPELRELAVRVAAVLELRTGGRVVVGDAPPPALPEAVPDGHMAIVPEDGSIRLVLGVRGGRSVDSQVVLTEARRDSQVRAIALAAESLHDTAHAVSDASDPAPALLLVQAAEATALAPAPPLGDRTAAAADSGAEPSEGLHAGGPRVEPLLYARVYSGASTASTAPMAGLGTGVGLCVVRQCLFVAGEIPATTGSSTALDVRYRYLTFLSGFYSRPISFGPLTPGISLGFLTRLGHFRADMGYRDTGLDTDLGARGSVELAWEVVPRLDLMSEVGVDLTLDRHHVRVDEGSAVRGDRWSPWAQGALRFRP
jgi:hypothetical protein